MARLGDLIEQIRGVSYKPEDLCDSLNEDGIPLLRASNIQDGKLNFEDIIYIDKKKVKSNQYLKSGDILVCTSSGSKELVGKAAFVENDLSMTFGAFCKVIRPKICCPKYIGHFFDSPYYRKRISASSAGANINNIRNEHIDEIDIRLPSTDEQKQISAVLDKVSDLISLRKQQLAKLDELVKARFVELFGDPKSNPYSYPIGQLSEHIEFLTSGSRGWAQYCVDNGSEWFITIKNVKDCRISIDNMQPINAPDNAEAKRTKVQEGDLLISITADLGRTGVVTKEIADHGAYINQHLTCIRLNKEILNPLYVAFFMESPAGKEQFESKNQSAVKAGLNFNSINSLRLLVPPMDEQSAFVEFVHQVDKSKVAVQKALDKAQLLFDSLMQKYFG